METLDSITEMAFSQAHQPIAYFDAVMRHTDVILLMTARIVQ